MKTVLTLLLVVASAAWTTHSFAADITLAPPTHVSAEDVPNDIGTQVLIKWHASPDEENAGTRSLDGYAIYRKIAQTSEGLESIGEAGADASELGFPANFDFEDTQPIGSVSYGRTKFVDENVEAGNSYLYAVAATGPGGTYSPISVASSPVTAEMQWFNGGKFWFLIITAVISFVIIAFVVIAKKGGEIRVRKIAGLEAVSEAVGRATEMGKPVLFVPGILDINDIQTVAGITVLSNVAKTSARYDAKLRVPTARSLVMTTARETVEAAYLGEGRPDAYNENDIYYLTDEQFGYTAGVQGVMVRERPAACFYMGAFYAESLILAETANSIGSIQIAGTAMPSQLPFFVAACDYTLIGEEFFAASAYLSNDPEQLGSLKGQDIGKIMAAGLLVVGCVLATIAVTSESRTAQIAELYIKDNILGADGLVPNADKVAQIDAELDAQAQQPHAGGGGGS
ncbi:MAG: hypothetical protein MK100_05150 [Phycisphaerales bacterium]|nr:hypothetical protein [Phycisphaerales bacterium]